MKSPESAYVLVVLGHSFQPNDYDHFRFAAFPSLTETALQQGDAAPLQGCHVSNKLL